MSSSVGVECLLYAFIPRPKSGEEACGRVKRPEILGAALILGTVLNSFVDILRIENYPV